MLVRSTIVLGICCTLILLAEVSSGAAARAGSTTASTSITQVTYDTSCEKDASTTVAMGECVQSEYDQVKNQLSAELALEAKQFGARVVSKVQEEWLTYMRSSCAAFSGAVGGSAHGIYVGSCELGLTIDRLIDVRKSLTFNPIGR